MDDPASTQALIDANDGFTMHQVPATDEVNEALVALYTDAYFDGLGIIANKTFVDSKSTADDDETPLPLIGLGDSANLILFYEKDAIQLPIACNQRDRFMQSKPRSWRDAHYVEDYAQVDINGSYDINKHLTVFFKGINVTNELYITTAEYKNQYLDITETGPRYSVGIRGSF